MAIESSNNKQYKERAEIHRKGYEKGQREQIQHTRRVDILQNLKNDQVELRAYLKDVHSGAINEDDLIECLCHITKAYNLINKYIKNRGDSDENNQN